MSRLLTVGAETSNTSTEPGVTSYPTSGNATVTIVSTPVRTGVYAFRCYSGTSANQFALIEKTATLTAGLRFFMRAYVRFPSFGNDPEILSIWDGSASDNLAEMSVNSSGAVQLRIAGSAVGSTPTLTTNNWHRLELAIEVNGAGSDFVAARVNGTEIHSTSTASTGGTTGATGQFWFGINGVIPSGFEVFLDDIALNNENGNDSLQNTWLGDTLLPYNPIFICGAECGLTGLGTAGPGVEHWTTGFTGSIETSGPSTMPSTRVFRFNPSAAASEIATHTFASSIASPGHMVTRFRIYFATLPDANCTLVYQSGQDSFGLLFRASDSSLVCGNFGGTVAAFSKVVETGVWYVVSYQLARDGGTVHSLTVDGVNIGSENTGGVSSAITSVTFGVDATSGTISADVYYDDFIVSSTASDYPIPDGTCVGLYPNGDLTNSAANPTDGNSGHFYSDIFDFRDGAGGASDLAAQNVETDTWQSLAKPLSTSVGTNFLNNRVGSSTEHLVHIYDDMPIDVVAVNGVACVSTHHAASATANTQRLLVRRGTTSDFYPILDSSAFADLSDTTIITCYRCKALDSASESWTKTTVDTLQTVWDADDVNPDAYLDGICFEVDYIKTPTGVPPAIRIQGLLMLPKQIPLPGMNNSVRFV